MLKLFTSNFTDRSNIIPGLSAFIVWMSVHTFIAVQNIAPRNFFMRDPLVLARKFASADDGKSQGIVCCPPYLGFVSSLGVVMWFMTAAIALMGASVVRSKTYPYRKFLIFGGIFSIVLGSDDLFQLHEKVLPSLGVPELATLAIYAIIACIYLLYSSYFITNKRIPFLIIAFVLFTFSVIVDLFPGIVSRAKYWEDTFKFGGIIFWTTFHALFVFDILRKTTKDEQPSLEITNI